MIVCVGAVKLTTVTTVSVHIFFLLSFYCWSILSHWRLFQLGSLMLSQQSLIPHTQCVMC